MTTCVGMPNFYHCIGLDTVCSRRVWSLLFTNSCTFIFFFGLKKDNHPFPHWEHEKENLLWGHRAFIIQYNSNYWSKNKPHTMKWLLHLPIFMMLWFFFVHPLPSTMILTGTFLVYLTKLYTLIKYSFNIVGLTWDFNFF